MEGRMVTDKIQCLGFRLMRSKRNFRASWVVCVCVCVCFCVLCRVWWSLFTTSCQEGFSSFAAVLHCRQCSSLRATGLTSGENQSKIQPFRLKLNGFKESWWWAISNNGRTFMISEATSCIFFIYFFIFITWSNLGKEQRSDSEKPNITCLTLCTIDLLYLCHLLLLPYIFLLFLPPFVRSWLELEACSPSVRFVVYKTRHCPEGR